jgi:hypothetical protein
LASDAATARLYLHEVVDIVGQGAVPYMAHTVAFDAAAAADGALALFGTWYVMGSTGRWPQVVNIWELRGGWQGWRALCERTNLRREQNAELDEWWEEAYRHRSGGFDRLLVAADGCPSLDDLRARGVTGTVFVHELSSVRPGEADAYLAAVRDEWAPARARDGHELVGLYRAAFDDTEVCTVWATDLDHHVAHQQADTTWWRIRAREHCTRWHEELMVPGAGTPLAG